jgi:hypothetical protein
LAELEGLFLADAPERWAALGFALEEGQTELGGVRLVLGVAGTGITAWTLDPVDGLASRPLVRSTAPAREHPNGALGVDHVVVVTPAFERTRDALAGAGMPLKRLVEMRGTRMGFRRIGPAILEVVEAPEAERVAFWGLVIIVEDLDALSARLGDRCGPIKPAVQPGRRIATVRAGANLSTNLAFMDPDPR